ncbi:MAG: hypothetical protein E7663_03740 [Ruminococcaceae bacterium]|nr:hypothetical protein [Oscillospiraceae bacterium]
MNFLHSKKFKHGSVSLALTVVIIAAVILVNAIFTAFSDKYLWYLDMTPEPTFTLSDAAKELLDGVDTSHSVKILFCSERDAWESNSTQLEVLKTATDIRDYFDGNGHKNITVEFTDIFINPSAVKDYRIRTGKDIDSKTVVMTSGNEVRVYNLQEFFQLNEASAVEGYNGEKVFVSSILALTQDEAPVVCVTQNHGESDKLINDPALLDLLSGLGFEIKPINLSTEEIPANCRLLLIFGPKSDFLERDGISDISEIDKLESYLEGDNSMMVFFDKDTPRLQNLEKYLAEWGIEIARSGDENYMIKDVANSLTTSGFTPKADYITSGTGADITAQLREENNPKTVVFPNTTALKLSSLYTKRGSGDSAYGDYTDNGTSRQCYRVFSSSKDAVAMVNGAEVAHATATDPFSYMMLSCQSVMHDDTQTISHSFVLASASTDFASTAALDTKYGNYAAISYACNTMGSLVTPVPLDCKYYASLDIASITAREATQYTVVLAVVPASIVFIAGIYIMVRRKYA